MVDPYRTPSSVPHSPNPSKMIIIFDELRIWMKMKMSVLGATLSKKAWGNILSYGEGIEYDISSWSLLGLKLLHQAIATPEFGDYF
jgi:hypothetical protein